MTQRLLTLCAALLLGGAAFLTTSDSAQADDPNEIRFVLTGIDAEEGGTVRCALYRDANTWLDEDHRFRRSAARVRGPRAACVFRDIPPGTYAMAALHDEDGDREMDTVIGIPREGFAISNNEIDAMSRPDFDEAAIQYRGGRLVTRARMNYR